MGRLKYEIEFYKKSNGRCPTKTFLDGLSRQDVVRINKALDRLAKYGQDLGRPNVAYLRDNIWELRVRTQHGRYRLLHFFYAGQRFVITHGIKKKTRKVPDSEIDTAIEYRNDYLERKAQG